MKASSAFVVGRSKSSTRSASGRSRRLCCRLDAVRAARVGPATESGRRNAGRIAMDNTRKLWIGLATLLGLSFAILLLVGGQIHRKAPPMPERVVSTQGTVVFERADIERGRSVWQSFGGMQLGSIWGHGGYVAPDWTADWVHREAVALLDIMARRNAGAPYDQLDAERQAGLVGRLQQVIRVNTYDPVTATITLDQDRVAAISNAAAHYESLFGNDP